jgi:hypothetical protein
MKAIPASGSKRRNYSIPCHPEHGIPAFTGGGARLLLRAALA